MTNYKERSREMAEMLGARLWESRKQKGLTINQAANLLAVGYQTLRRMEKGDQGVAMGSYLRAFDFYGVSARELSFDLLKRSKFMMDFEREVKVDF